MVFKWALVFFGVMAIGLFVLSKILAFFNPPRPGRPGPPVLRRVERALRWTVLLPLAIVIALLALALAGRP
jgi:predicted MFS family arabinose efflux permease